MKHPPFIKKIEKYEISLYNTCLARMFDYYTYIMFDRLIILIVV